MRGDGFSGMERQESPGCFSCLLGVSDGVSEADPR